MPDFIRIRADENTELVLHKLHSTPTQECPADFTAAEAEAYRAALGRAAQGLAKASKPRKGS